MTVAGGSPGREARKRAERKKKPFTITEHDIVIPSLCPVLGIPLFVGNRSIKNNSPSLDEIVPGKGYIKGNVIIMSWRANRLKSDATLGEIVKIHRFAKRHMR